MFSVVETYVTQTKYKCYPLPFYWETDSQKLFLQCILLVEIITCERFDDYDYEELDNNMLSVIK